MNCTDLETLLCDFLDGTLGPAQKLEVESHLQACASCASAAADAAACMAFLRNVPPPEAPPALVTRIVFELTHDGPLPARSQPRLLAWLRKLLDPVLQPRFAMGMAMTILSLSLLARVAGIHVRQLSASDLNPVRIWQAADDRLYRSWMRARRFYYNLRFVYEIRSRLAELDAPQEEDAGPPRARPDAGDWDRGGPPAGIMPPKQTEER